METRKVREVRTLAPGIFELCLERDAYAYEVGECSVLHNDSGDSRPYSIASGRDDEVLRYLIRTFPGGAVSEWLEGRQPGDEVGISPSFGRFRPGSGGGRSVFIATGVGIAPFLSYLRSESPELLPTCLYGVRRLRDAVEVDMLRERTDLRLATSRETAVGCFHGRVTAMLEDMTIDADTHFYLCGIDGMVDEVAYWLDDHGVSHTHVHTEVFFSNTAPQ